MAKRPLYLLAYDIKNSKRLQQALKIIKTWATGGQKSVFECYLTDADKQALLTAMKKILNTEEDRFFILRLDTRIRVHVMGMAVEPVTLKFFYIG